MRVHLFPSRTQKLSSCTPTILGGRLPGKIGNANTRPHSFGCEVFSIDWNRRMSTCFRLRCPAKSASDEADLISADRGTCLPTRFIRHRRRSCAQPSRTQKLSSCTPTILGGRLPGKIGNANTEPPAKAGGFFLPSSIPVAVPDICLRRQSALAFATAATRSARLIRPGGARIAPLRHVS